MIRCPSFGVLHGRGTMWIDIGARMAGSTNDLLSRAAILAGCAGKSGLCGYFLSLAWRVHRNKRELTPHLETRMTTLKIRSLLTGLASLLAAIATIIVAVLPAMLTTAT